LPGLERALDPAVLGSRLAPLVGGEGALTVRLLKHVPGKRAVLGFEFENGRRAVGKMVRKDRAERHAAMLGELGAALAGSVRVPRVLGCWMDLGLVLQEWVPGEPAPEWSELAQDLALVDRLGGALALLHACRVESAPVMDLEAQLRRTCHPGIGALAADRPDLGKAAVALESALLERERDVAIARVTSHGDFGPRQVFASPQAIWFVDLDGLCQTNAAFDVAHFCVGLEAHAEEASAAPRARFLDAYRRAGGTIAPQALAVHEAFCDLRRALVLWRKQPPRWEVDCARALDRGRARF
jgi:aminoglycoside phosphotransferase